MAKTTETPRNREGEAPSELSKETAAGARDEVKKSASGDAPADGEHWASPGLPPPPINHADKGASPGGPAVRRDASTDEYIREAKVRNTQAGD